MSRALLALAWIMAMAGCAAPRAYRVRFKSLKTSIIVYETQAQVSRQCEKHIRRWEIATGKTATLDSGAPRAVAQEYRGCMVPAKHPGGYKHILTSLETIDNGFHELCHALGAATQACDEIHFDGRNYPGRTIEIE